jgi:hypothetical protein
MKFLTTIWAGIKSFFNSTIVVEIDASFLENLPENQIRPIFQDIFDSYEKYPDTWSISEVTSGNMIRLYNASKTISFTRCGSSEAPIHLNTPISTLTMNLAEQEYIDFVINALIWDSEILGIIESNKKIQQALAVNENYLNENTKGFK